MKRYIGLILPMIFLLIFAGCSGNVKDVQITDYDSEIYTEKEIEDAIDVATDYFKKEFSGCTLMTITYAGDEKSQDHIEWATRNDADEVIVLISSFDVDASGGDGSLNPNSTYENWMWILVRDSGGNWKHVDHGY